MSSWQPDLHVGTLPGRQKERGEGKRGRGGGQERGKEGGTEEYIIDDA